MATCREITCCDPVSEYKADANPEATVPNSGGCPVASVSFNPADGSYVIFPTLVAISSNVAGVTIRYTIDGTEPTSASTLYSVPLSVTSPTITVKARAFVDGCDPGPVGEATYLPNASEDFAFTYLCETGDNVGVFSEFAANGQANDYQFVLSFTLAALTEILDITILQTDATGFWNSGQSWSTTEWIYPFPDPTIPFHTYPLVLIDQAGPTQLFTAYQTTLGNYAAGNREWRLWGQPFTTLNGYFQLTITLGNGTQIKRLINTTCSESVPTLCPTPPAPTVTVTCLEANVVGVIAPETAFIVYRRTTSTLCGQLTWAPYTSGESDVSGVVDITDDGIQPCCTYQYYIAAFCNGFYTDGAPSDPVIIPCECDINLEASADAICFGTNVTLSWNGEHCLAIEYSTNGIDFDGLELVGDLIDSPAETTTYTFRGTSSSCGTTTTSVTVTVIKAPVIESVTVDPLCGCVGDDVTVSWVFSASGGVPTAVTVNGFAQTAGMSGSGMLKPLVVPIEFEVCGSNECGESCDSVTFEDCCLPCACPPDMPTSVTINYPDTDAFFCVGSLYTDPGFPTGPTLNGGSCLWDGFLDHVFPNFDHFYYSAFVGFIPCVKWILEINGRDSNGNQILVWGGEKTVGNSPLGTYTKTGGCAAEATLTVS